MFPILTIFLFQKNLTQLLLVQVFGIGLRAHLWIKSIKWSTKKPRSFTFRAIKAWENSVFTVGFAGDKVWRMPGWPSNMEKPPKSSESHLLKKVLWCLGGSKHHKQILEACEWILNLRFLRNESDNLATSQWNSFSHKWKPFQPVSAAMHKCLLMVQETPRGWSLWRSVQ